MKISAQVSLSNYSTMRLGGIAQYVIDIHDNDELLEAIQWAKSKKFPIVMVGRGSNIVWSDKGFQGVLLVNKITQFELKKEPDGSFLLYLGAGENWDSVVARSVNEGASGIEALSLIPGTAGATPIQNVGAYGQEIAQTLQSVEAYDLETDQIVFISKSECDFSYRNSRFKSQDRGRYLITHLTLRLNATSPSPPFYPAVKEYLDEHLIHNPTAQIIRNAVVDIRSSKLPDPEKVANNGSFFSNPLIEKSLFEQVKNKYPEVKFWEASNGRIKLSAAWLIEQAGFKNIHDSETGMATWEKQPLVLVNEHAKNTADLLKFKQKIVDGVKNKFGVTLEQEPELLP